MGRRAVPGNFDPYTVEAGLGEIDLTPLVPGLALLDAEMKLRRRGLTLVPVPGRRGFFTVGRRPTR